MRRLPRDVGCLAATGLIHRGACVLGPGKCPDVLEVSPGGGPIPILEALTAAGRDFREFVGRILPSETAELTREHAATVVLDQLLLDVRCAGRVLGVDVGLNPVGPGSGWLMKSEHSVAERRRLLGRAMRLPAGLMSEGPLRVPVRCIRSRAAGYFGPR